MASKKVTYKARTADLRVLNKRDLVSKGLDDSVDFKQTEFWRGQPVEVDSAVASILLEHEVFKGEFEESSDDDQPAEAAATDKQTTVKSPAKR